MKKWLNYCLLLIKNINETKNWSHLKLRLSIAMLPKMATQMFC